MKRGLITLFILTNNTTYKNGTLHIIAIVKLGRKVIYNF